MRWKKQNEILFSYFLGAGIYLGEFEISSNDLLDRMDD